MLRVSEVFTSVQAEGAHTGTPAVFLRLRGCGVQCPWCDTPYTWKVPAKPVPFAELIAAPAETPVMAEVNPVVLAEWAATHAARHVVITGGEPLEQGLTRLYAALIAHGFYIQIETSGTVAVPDKALVHVDWLTVSPKIGMPGGLKVQPRMLELADEIKMPVGRTKDLAHLFDLLEHVRPGTPVWLQPLSLNRKATDLCLHVAAREGWKVSLQGHKLAGVR